MAERPERVEQAYLEACLAELTALKPGNVHAYAAGHDMTVANFEASARASAPVMAETGFTVGQRILESIRHTRSVVACNTNLGIVLLCAPLAQAALAAGGTGLRLRVQEVLQGLTVDDAERAFAAIRLANPGGLGQSARYDVQHPPAVTLRAAMAAARDRDRIAAQYCTGYADVFEFGLDRLAAGRARWREPEWATAAAYLGFLAAFPDSHVARKFGPTVAETVMADARPLERQLQAAADPNAILTDLKNFDRALKDKGINPGTSADLTVATLFVSYLE
jgi:triphosphoribosyl-dephospho-CoA synthase